MYSYPFLQCLYVFYWVALLSTGLLGYHLLRFPPRPLIATISFTFFCLSSLSLVAYKVSDGYTGAGLNEATLYQLSYGLSGLENDMKAPLLLSAGIFVLCLVLFGITLLYRTKHTLRFPLQPIKKHSFAFYILLMSSLCFNPGLIQSVMLLNKISSAHLSKKDLAPLVLRPDFSVLPAQKKSVVYIYLESFEGTFLRQDIFPGLAPHLYALSQEGTSFHGIREVAFTGWTIAGQMASNCGFPGMKNTQRSYPCVADILSKSGYHQVYMNGASMDFAGQGGFWHSKGYGEVLGNREIRAAHPSLPKSKWGVYDDDFFQLSLMKYRDMKKRGQPFVLTLLSLDTHGPSGLSTPLCRKDPFYVRLREAQEILSAVACTDRIVGEFVREIRKEDPDVLIVVQSDHLQRDSADIGPFLRRHESKRENLFFVVGRGIPRQYITRSATMFDVAPTFLSLLGYRTTYLNLGRSLFAPQKTLAEEKGMRGSTEKWTPFYLPKKFLCIKILQNNMNNIMNNMNYRQFFLFCFKV